MEIIKLIAELVDVELDSDGHIYVILNVENRTYAKQIIRILKLFKNKNIKIKVSDVRTQKNEPYDYSKP